MKRERRLTTREVREQINRRDVHQVTIACPGCTGRATIHDSDPPAVLHTLPTCARYDAIETVDDAVSFMREARAKSNPETFN